MIRTLPCDAFLPSTMFLRHFCDGESEWRGGRAAVNHSLDLKPDFCTKRPPLISTRDLATGPIADPSRLARRCFVVVVTVIVF